MYGDNGILHIDLIFWWLSGIALLHVPCVMGMYNNTAPGGCTVCYGYVHYHCSGWVYRVLWVCTITLLRVGVLCVMGMYIITAPGGCTVCSGYVHDHCSGWVYCVFRVCT